MENESRLSRAVVHFKEKLAEQVWFQQLKEKWDELDPQSRTYLKTSAGVLSVLFLVGFTFSSWWGVRSLKKELAEKNDLIQLIANGNEELRRMRESLPAGAAAAKPESGAQAWAAYIETTAASAGITKESLAVGAEAEGKSTDLAKESLIDLTLKKINIKQLTRLAFNLESGSRPVKLRHLSIDTKGDGVLDASMSVSAFTIKP